MDERVDGWMKGWIERKMDECMSGQMDRKWIDGWMDRKMDEWISG